jgi:predicted alpha/beta superfamily hydrolase
MKKILFVLSFFVFTLGYSQKVNDSIYSKKLNSTRKISLSLPPSYFEDKNRNYPLLLLLDGDYLHNPFQGALSYGNYWDDLPEMIVVGIYQNEDEERFDDCSVGEETGLPDKKGADFFDFIESELLPYIAKEYRPSPFKIIAGHDLTGGFLNYFLYKDNPAFNAYISLSPELQQDMGQHLLDKFSSIKKPVFYYLASADGDVKQMQLDIASLDESLKAVAQQNTNINYKYDDFKNSNHYSLVLHAVPGALYHIFASFQPISSVEYKENIVTLPSGYVNYLKAKYEKTEKTLGYKVQARYNDFKAIEAAIVKNKAFPEFEQLAQYASKMFPKTMLSEYYMGRFYEGGGDVKKALKSFKNAYTQNAVGELTKDFIISKIEELNAVDKK